MKEKNTKTFALQREIADESDSSVVVNYPREELLAIVATEERKSIFSRILVYKGNIIWRPDPKRIKNVRFSKHDQLWGHKVDVRSWVSSP